LEGAQVYAPASSGITIWISSMDTTIGRIRFFRRGDFNRVTL
jgi:hypothetical protein